MKDLRKSMETKSKSKLSYYKNKRNSGQATLMPLGTPEIKRESSSIRRISKLIE